MKIISKNINQNEYIRIDNDAPLVEWLSTAIQNSTKKILLKNKKFYHVIIKYPNRWPEDLDLFKFIEKDAVKEIKNKNCYFIFNASAEGFNPYQWFKILYFTCEKHNIDPKQIIFVSSNLKDDNNIKLYCKNKNKKLINVITLPFFEHACKTSDNITQLLKTSISETEKTFNGNYFSSLSRLNRLHRSIGTFLLCQSNIKNQGLISHDRIRKNNNYTYTEVINKTQYSIKDIKRWKKSLPFIVDYTDFKINWAAGRAYDHIHNQTLFQIVNETLVENYNNTSLFYSEKTFRPISCFQPFLIYGQVGCNHHLKNLGYKTYEGWFDLSFDYEEDYIRRYQKLLTVVEDTCKYLDSLPRNKQIEWKFKHQEILIHNIKTMNNREYTSKKLEKFVLDLENQIEAQLE